MKAKLLPNQDLNFHFNPFSGITDCELYQTLVPKYNLEAIAHEIKNTPKIIIEFAGKRGRGKTTHLKHLHQVFFPTAPLSVIKVKSQYKELQKQPKKLVFIDGIYHLTLFQRLKIYKAFNKIVLTTHQTRWSEYKITQRIHKSYRFKELDLETLKTIIKKRLDLTVVTAPKEKYILDEAYLRKLLQHYGDDIRSILNTLYKDFQN